MRKVERSDLVDYQTYAERRDAIRQRALAEKQRRRVNVGEHLTFLFETTETIAYHIQEMMRLEQIEREADIQHELSTYNQLLGDAGELGCTLLVEINDPAEREQKLNAWVALPQHLYLLTAAGERVAAKVDLRQADPRRLASVQYLKFRLGAAQPVALGVDLPGLKHETQLSPEQRQLLLEDALT